MYMDNKPLNRIKVVMAERMVSNKELGEMLGKDTATISRWVTNTSQPTLESLIEIAKALKCDIGDLVRMAGGRCGGLCRDGQRRGAEGHREGRSQDRLLHAGKPNVLGLMGSQVVLGQPAVNVRPGLAKQDGKLGERTDRLGRRRHRSRA